MRGLGWQLKTTVRLLVEIIFKNSFGHTGFTGTSLWIDTEVDLSVIADKSCTLWKRTSHFTITTTSS